MSEQMLTVLAFAGVLATIVFAVRLSKRITEHTVPTCRCGRWALPNDDDHAEKHGTVHERNRCYPKKEKI